MQIFVLQLSCMLRDTLYEYAYYLKNTILTHMSKFPVSTWHLNE